VFKLLSQKQQRYYKRKSIKSKKEMSQGLIRFKILKNLEQTYKQLMEQQGE
jgi:hypothetical protein